MENRLLHVYLRYPANLTQLTDTLAFNNNSFRQTVVKSAGNTAAFDDDNDGSGYIYDIATGYNILTVGNYVDNNNSDPSDDVMSNFSSWRNSTSYNGDREKPDVVAPGGSNIRTTGSSSSLMEVNGTSFLAPVVAGGTALLMQRYPNFRYEPEALKAFIIATARNNITGNNIPWNYEDSQDVYGGVDFDLADKVLTGQANGGQTARDYTCGVPSPYNISMNLTTTNPYRIAMTWKVNPDYPNYDMQPNVDLDMTIKAPKGSIVGTSGSLDNNVESEYIQPTVTGTYTMAITAKRCINGYLNTRIARPGARFQHHIRPNISITPHCQVIL